MKSFVTAAALLAVVPFAMGQQLQVISLTGVVECEPILISWTGGSPPYFLSLIPAGQPSAAALKQFPEQQGTSYTWLVDLPAGTGFTTALKDSTGQLVFSGNQQVEGGSSSSCVNTAIIESGSASGAGATTPGGAAANPTSSGTQPGATTASITTTAGVSHSSGAAAASGSGATPSTTQNAAVRDSSVGLYGLTGLIGLIGAAFF